jgi:hypothetical protein
LLNREDLNISFLVLMYVHISFGTRIDFKM